VRDNGAGEVITTEMSPDKITAARGIFTQTGLVVTILEVDARETLATVDREADFVFLDGWQELCLPVLKVLEPGLRSRNARRRRRRALRRPCGVSGRCARSS
jgi:predicted O-methyltransferase YrrM